MIDINTITCNNHAMKPANDKPREEKFHSHGHNLIWQGQSKM